MDKNIYQRLIEVQKKVKSVYKSETVKVTSSSSYKAVSHDDVMALLHDPLADAGIVLLPKVVSYQCDPIQVEKRGYDNKTYQAVNYQTSIQISVKWINSEKPDDCIETNSYAMAIDSSDKGFGKAYSMALKTALLKVHLLESTDEEEQRTIGETDKIIQPKPAKKEIKRYPPPMNKEPEVEASIDPAHFIMPFGQSTKGKKLSELSENQLKTALNWVYDQMNTDLPAAHFKQMLDVATNIKEFLASVGVEIAGESYE